MTKKKIIINLTEDWFFVSHFLGRAANATASGYEVYISCNETSKRKIIENNNIKFLPLALDRRGINPLYELLIILKYCFLFYKIKPDIVHNVGSKPIIYGSIAAKFLNIKSLINAPIGLGFAFSSDTFRAKLLKPVLIFLLSHTLNKHHGKGKENRVIFENSDDMNYFIRRKIVKKSDARLIRGAGVEIDYKYKKKKKINKNITISLVARMLKDKGIFEFVNAARILNKRNFQCRFLLVGDIDQKNPSSLKTSTLKSWHEKGIIEWLGWIDNIQEILYDTDILCLPSYREGLPKSLLEGAAIGLPLVTTNTVGCRDIVVDGVNGYLVPVKDSVNLALAIEKLIRDKELRAKMGNESLKLAISKFSSKIINSQTISLYNEL